MLTVTRTFLQEQTDSCCSWFSRAAWKAFGHVIGIYVIYSDYLIKYIHGSMFTHLLKYIEKGKQFFLSLLWPKFSSFQNNEILGRRCSFLDGTHVGRAHLDMFWLYFLAATNKLIAIVLQVCPYVTNQQLGYKKSHHSSPGV